MLVLRETNQSYDLVHLFCHLATTRELTLAIKKKREKNKENNSTRSKCLNQLIVQCFFSRNSKRTSEKKY